MSETTSAPAKPATAARPEPPAHRPGRSEAEALRGMHEIEAAPREPGRHYCAIPDPEIAGGYEYHLFVWQTGVNAWRRVGAGSYGRDAALAELARHVEYADVTLTDAFVHLDGIPRAALDEAVSEGRTLLCPEGVPGQPDAWVAIGLDRDGRGTPIHAGNRVARIGLPAALLEHGRKLPGDPSERTIFVRHARAARSVVAKANWGVGRPDLAGRRIDEELARNAQDAIDRDRAWREDGIRPEQMPAYRYARQQQGTW